MHHPNDDIWLIPRQEQVETLCMAMSGLSNEEIGKRTWMAASSIQAQLSRVYEKLLVFSESTQKLLTMAACKAIRIGLVRYNYERGEYEPNPDFKMEGKVTRQSVPSRVSKLSKEEQNRIGNERAIRRRMDAGFTDEMIQKAKENLLSDDALTNTEVIKALLLLDHYNSEFWEWGKTKVEELKKELEKSHPEQMKRRAEILAKRRARSSLKPDHPWRLDNECSFQEHQPKKRVVVLTD